MKLGEKVGKLSAEETAYWILEFEKEGLNVKQIRNRD